MSEPRRVELEAPLRELLEDDGLDAVALERVRRRVAATRRVGRVTARPVALAAAAAALLVAGASYVLWPGGTPSGPLERAAGGALAVIEGETRLSDGSTIVPEGEVAIAVVENTGARLALAQGRGRVAYRVTPGGPRSWSIDAGVLTIEVVGTRFVVERTETDVRVDVERGRVRVRGERVPGGRRTLSAGESLAVSSQPADVDVAAPSHASRRGRHASGAVDTLAGGPAAEAAASDSSGEPAPPLRAEPIVAASPTTTDRSPAGSGGAASGHPSSHGASAASRIVSEGATSERTSRWRELARASEHAAAFDALGPEGVARETTTARSVEDLLLLADVARGGQRPELAVAPLEAILARHAGHPRAGWAALTLGRLHLDSIDRPADAVAALERALDLGLSPRLRETALARLVEAHRRAGHPERALLVAAQYRSEFPNGRYLAPLDRDPR